MPVNDPFGDSLQGIKPRANFTAQAGQQAKPVNTAQQAQFTNTHLQNPSVMKQPQQPASFTQNVAHNTSEYGYQTGAYRSRPRAPRPVGGGMPMPQTQQHGTTNWEGVHQVLNGLQGRGGQNVQSHEQFSGHLPQQQQPSAPQQQPPAPQDQARTESNGTGGGMIKKAASVLTKAPEAAAEV